MNVLTRSVSGAWGAVKAAAGAVVVRFMNTSHWGATWLGRTRLDIAGRVGDGSHNSIVVACRAWVERAWPEAPIVVKTINSDGEWAVVEDHPLAALLRRPNPYYSGVQLLTATLADRLLTGNGYWIKRRGGAVGGGRGRVVELWWVPSYLMHPRWPELDDTVFISHYDYLVNGTVTRYDPADVVHFRRGFDPANVRLGRNDLKDLLGEIFTDEEASSYIAAILANMGVPGVIISPEANTRANVADLEDVKAKFMDRFGGDNRGQPLVMKGATKVSVLSFSPEQMKTRENRRIPEERVTAVIGIPAIVVGLGAGLDRSTFANMAEAREAAYESHIIPDHRLFDADLETQLVPDFGDPAKIRVSHDYSEVRVLQADQNELHARAREDLTAGLLTLNQALEMIGEDVLPGPEGDVRLIPNAVTPTHPAELQPGATAPKPVPPALAPFAGGAPADPNARTVPADPGIAPVSAAAGRRRPADPIPPSKRNAKAAVASTVSPSSIGSPLVLSDADLDEQSKVGPDDLTESEKFWREAVDGSGLENLTDAEPDGGA